VVKKYCHHLDDLHVEKISIRYPPGSFMHKMRKRRIIETLAAFAGVGVVIIELAHHVSVK
jgi:hypothetical protein